MSNRYRKEINGREYGVRIRDGAIITTVRIKTGFCDWNKTLLVRRELFCEDVQRFAARTLNDAVQQREKNIEDSERYDEQIERALDVVQEQYDS